MIATLKHHPGELIEHRYEVQSVLGSGAFGTVYRCLDHEIDVLVAVKELHVLDDPDTSTDERQDALAQFRREAVHLSSLRHPHIVSGHYQPHSGTWLACPVCGHTFKGIPVCPEHGARPVVVRQRNYLVMEYLEGPNLGEAAELAGGAMPVPDAVHAILQTADALQLIHTRGWLHRDVKPENIRLRASGGPGHDEAVLLDFGIATESGAEGEFSTRAQRHTDGGGTLGYAPDSPSERRFPDARSDIHALGMTLYRLVSGRDPTEPDELLQMRRKRPRDFNQAIPPQLEAIILKAIQPDPARRHQSAREFAQELGAIIEPLDTGAIQPNGSHSPVAPETMWQKQGAGSQAQRITPTVAAPLVPPLVFRSGEMANDIPGMIALIEKYPHEAKERLYFGDLTDWLARIGQDDLARRAREITRTYPNRKDQGLEALAQATGLVEPPSLQAHPLYLDFGIVEPSGKKTISLELRNNGRGHLFGLMRTSHRSLQGPRSFDGNHVVVPITINTKKLAAGRHSGDLVIDSSAGELRLPFSVEVKRQPLVAPSMTVVLWAMLGMMAGFHLRALPFALAQYSQGWKWLAGTNSFSWYPTAPLFGLVLWAVLLVFVVGEAMRQKSCMFFVSTGMFVTLLAFLCGLIGDHILIAGDQLLRPVMEPLTHRWAAGAWMCVGGLAGAIYGTLRRWTDLLTSRVSGVVLGWIVAIFLLYGVLVAGLYSVPAYR